MNDNQPAPLHIFTHEELDLAGQIEICVGPFQTSEVRREAMETLLREIHFRASEELRAILGSAARLAQIRL